MHLGRLQFNVQYCIVRAEQAMRDDERQRWLQIADSWRHAIECRRTLPDFLPEWRSLKLVAAGEPDPTWRPGVR
jgi:hypothetical protein